LHTKKNDFFVPSRDEEKGKTEGDEEKEKEYVNFKNGNYGQNHRIELRYLQPQWSVLPLN
jgi:hypothetical protein